MLLYPSVNRAILNVLYVGYDFGEKLKNAPIYLILKDCTEWALRQTVFRLKSAAD